MVDTYSYREFVALVTVEYEKAVALLPNTRYGQVYFNTLWDFEPAIANEIRATKYDPFHLSEVHPETHAHIEQLWLERINDSQ
jgi:hypothetical protein